MAMKPTSVSMSPSSSLFLQRLRMIGDKLKRKPLAAAGLGVIAALVSMAILAPWVAPHDPYAQELSASLLPPSIQHFLGTDGLGRDVFSRLIYASRVALLAGVGSVSLAAFVGLTLGVTAGWFGGWVDVIVMRCIDALMIVPPVILALVVAAVLGGGLLNVTIAIGLALIPTYGRMTRSVVLGGKELDFVVASRAQGAGHVRLIVRHILPQCLSPLIVLATLNLGYAILGEAALSFLGAGITPPRAAWGAMVNDGYRYLVSHPLLSAAPGAAIMLMVLSFNVVGDALRDLLDPKIRGVV